MPNLYIVTDEENCYYGTKEYIEEFMPQATRGCVELVSDEMFDALMQVGAIREQSKAIAFLLYNILDKKSLTSN